MAKSDIQAGPRAAFSVSETCASLGVSKDWLYRQFATESIRSLKIAGRRFVPASELERIAQGRVAS